MMKERRLLVIGAGSRAAEHRIRAALVAAEELRAQGVVNARIVGLADPDPAALRRAASFGERVPTYDSYEQAVAVSTPHYVFNCGPEDQRDAAAIHCLQRGALVLSEPPFAPSRAAREAMLRAESDARDRFAARRRFGHGHRLAIGYGWLLAMLRPALEHAHVAVFVPSGATMEYSSPGGLSLDGESWAAAVAAELGGLAVVLEKVVPSRPVEVAASLQPGEPAGARIVVEAKVRHARGAESLLAIRPAADGARGLTATLRDGDDRLELMAPVEAADGADLAEFRSLLRRAGDRRAGPAPVSYRRAMIDEIQSILLAGEGLGEPLCGSTPAASAERLVDAIRRALEKWKASGRPRHDCWVKVG